MLVCKEVEDSGQGGKPKYCQTILQIFSSVSGSFRIKSLIPQALKCAETF